MVRVGPVVPNEKRIYSLCRIQEIPTESFPLAVFGTAGDSNLIHVKVSF